MTAQPSPLAPLFAECLGCWACGALVEYGEARLHTGYLPHDCPECDSPETLIPVRLSWYDVIGPNGNIGHWEPRVIGWDKAYRRYCRRCRGRLHARPDSAHGFTEMVCMTCARIAYTYIGTGGNWGPLEIRESPRPTESKPNHQYPRASGGPNG